MSTLQVDLPDEVRSRLAARAADAGFPSVEQYARAVLEASADGADEAGLEELLARRAADDRPGIEFTPAFADAFRRDVARRREERA